MSGFNTVEIIEKFSELLVQRSQIVGLETSKKGSNFVFYGVDGLH